MMHFAKLVMLGLVVVVLINNTPLQSITGAAA